ncbi:hypothetical protein BDV96DRAFT_262634 [Lophiotrema nucula]|uniref:CFEM domain-containing protein n=1 Tax=Lophiotrema nucula TaxID=690887 RepID=A0A6A5YPF2_9PLEO|nr:hypothetical protein BDV96DRAFT_262634 [Lophiotrema nucula]
MKSFTLVLTLALAFASSADAQTACSSVATAIPSCGQSCLLSAGSAVGCSSADYGCQCTSSSEIQATAINCVLGACDLGDALAVQSSASAVCACIATATPDAVAARAMQAAPGARFRY